MKFVSVYARDKLFYIKMYLHGISLLSYAYILYEGNIYVYVYI